MKLTFDSPVVLIFSFVCAGVFLLGQIDVGTELFVLYPEWDMSNPTWYVRIWSHSLGHANTEHLMSNMAFFLLLGPIVERIYGSKNLLIMILTTAIITGIIQIMFFDTGLLGASGVVFMLILLVSMVNFENKQIPLTFILIVLIYIGKEIWGTFDGKQDGISHSTHIVGGFIGAAFGFALAGKKAKKTEHSGNSII